LRSVPLWVGSDALLRGLKSDLLSKRKVLVIYGKSTVQKTALAIRLLEAGGAKVSSGMLALDCIFRQVVYLRITEGMGFQEAITELAQGLELDCNPDLYPEQAIDQIIAALQQTRYLIVLDNLENILTHGQAIVPEWSMFLWALVDKDHDSQIIITSREIPKDLADPNRPKSIPNPRFVRSFSIQPTYPISLKKGLVAGSMAIVGIGLTAMLAGRLNQPQSEVTSANLSSGSEIPSPNAPEATALPSAQNPSQPQTSTSNSVQKNTPNQTASQSEKIATKPEAKREDTAKISDPRPSTGQSTPTSTPPRTNPPIAPPPLPTTRACAACRWERGSSRNTSPTISSNGTIEIVAAPGTDAVPNTENRFLQTIENDFESTVRLKFNSNINYQRATLGVRSAAKGGFGTLRLSMIENQRIESFIYSGEAHLASGLKSSSSDNVYLKIAKKNGQLSAYFRSEGSSNWVVLIAPYTLDLPSKMDVFISVLSTDSSKSATATFSDWTITP
jgi:hypothetical protein